LYGKKPVLPSEKPLFMSLLKDSVFLHAGHFFAAGYGRSRWPAGANGGEWRRKVIKVITTSILKSVSDPDRFAEGFLLRQGFLLR
jgi:hypothetical protein